MNTEKAHASAREPWVTTNEVATHIGKPASWVYANAARVGLPRRKIGQHFRYRLSEVDTWMGGLEVPAP